MCRWIMCSFSLSGKGSMVQRLFGRVVLEGMWMRREKRREQRTVHTNSHIPSRHTQARTSTYIQTPCQGAHDEPAYSESRKKSEEMQR